MSGAEMVSAARARAAVLLAEVDELAADAGEAMRVADEEVAVQVADVDDVRVADLIGEALREASGAVELHRSLVTMQHRLQEVTSAA